MKYLYKGGVALALTAMILAGCVVTPRPPEPVAGPAPAESSRVVFYPAAGQSAEQQDRDRYECYRWAVAQSGFDPNASGAAPQRVEVVPMGPPPGINTFGGALTGAVIGSAVSSPRNAGGGALVGALAGAVLGAAVDAGNAEQVQRAQDRISQADSSRSQLQVGAFRRAMSACLTGRNYTVQ